MRELSFSSRWIAVMALAFLMLGCEVPGQLFLGTLEEIEERNAEAAQARLDLEPRSPEERSDIENEAIRIANTAIKEGRSKIKEAFCGSPPDLSSLPPAYFKFEPSIHISEDASEACRAGVDRRFPGLESCYLVFENGSTAYSNCYLDDESKSIACMSVKKLMWEILRHKEALHGFVWVAPEMLAG